MTAAASTTVGVAAVIVVIVAVVIMLLLRFVLVRLLCWGTLPLLLGLILCAVVLILPVVLLLIGCLRSATVIASSRARSCHRS